MKEKQLGFSLASSLLALGVVGLVAAVSSRVMLNTMNSQSSSFQKQELFAVRKVILDGLDCRATFGVTPASPLPISCPATVDLKNVTGSPLASDNKIGKWSFQPTCVDGQGLQISFTSPENDHFTHKSLSENRYAKHILGASDRYLCAELFQAGAVTELRCPPLHTMKGITSTGNPICEPRGTATCQWYSRGSIRPIGGASSSRPGNLGQGWSMVDGFGNVGDGNVSCPQGMSIAGVHCGADCSNGFSILCCDW